MAFVLWLRSPGRKSGRPEPRSRPQVAGSARLLVLLLDAVEGMSATTVSQSLAWLREFIESTNDRTRPAMAEYDRSAASDAADLAYRVGQLRFDLVKDCHFLPLATSL